MASSAERAQDPEDALRRMIEGMVPVVRERAQLLEEVTTALEGGDDPRALSLMRRYCGLKPLRVTR